MERPDDRAAQALFAAAMAAAGVGLDAADAERRGREFDSFLKDGWHLTGRVDAASEPLPIVRLEE